MSSAKVADDRRVFVARPKRSRMPRVPTPPGAPRRTDAELRRGEADAAAEAPPEAAEE